MEKNIEKIKSFEMFEYCSLCGKLYNLKSRKNHLKSKKHRKLLMAYNLTDSDVEIQRYNLMEYKNKLNEKNDIILSDDDKSEEDIMYLPVD